MKAVLMSGSYKKIEIEKNIIDFIIKNTKEKRNICFIAADFNDYILTDKLTNKLLIAFEENKLKFNYNYIVDKRIKKQEMINYIKNSDIVFLLGGDTLKQIQAIKNYGLTKYIKEKSIIIGISAGAINMAKTVVLAKDIEDNIPNMSIYKGIGISNINIEPHCDFENKEHLQDLIEASFVNEIILMTDNAYIIIDEKKYKYYGKYCILNKGKIFYNNKLTTIEKFLKEK